MITFISIIIIVVVVVATTTTTTTTTLEFIISDPTQSRYHVGWQSKIGSPQLRQSPGIGVARKGHVQSSIMMITKCVRVVRCKRYRRSRWLG